MIKTFLSLFTGKIGNKRAYNYVYSHVECSLFCVIIYDVDVKVF